MNIKILTCLLVVVAYSETGAIPPNRYADDFSKRNAVDDSDEATLIALGRKVKNICNPPRWPTSTEIPNERGQNVIIPKLGDNLIPFITDCIRHLNAKYQELDPPEKTTHFSPKMIKDLESVPQFYEDKDVQLLPIADNASLIWETSRNEDLPEQKLNQVFIPVIAHIARQLMINPDPRPISEQPDFDLRYLAYFDGETKEPEKRESSAAEDQLHRNILGFIMGKIIPGIQNVIDKVKLEESVSTRPPPSAYIMPNTVWNYINEEVVPVFAAGVLHIYAMNPEQYNDDGKEFWYYIKRLRSLGDRRLEGVSHGRRGPIWDKFVDRQKGNKFTPNDDFLYDKDKEEAMKNAELKITLELIEKEKELRNAMNDEGEKKLNSQIVALKNQMEILKLETAEKVTQRKKKEILAKMTKEEIANVNVELVQKVLTEYGILMKNKAKDDGASTTPSVAAT